MVWNVSVMIHRHREIGSRRKDDKIDKKQVIKGGIARRRSIDKDTTRRNGVDASR